MNSEKPFDQALELFMDCFVELHPRTSWPEWFMTSTMYGGTRCENGSWRFSFTAFPKSSLGANEIWEETERGYSLVMVDPKTGERRIVISSTPSEFITLFEAIVDVGNKKVNVILDSMVENFDCADLLPLRKL